LKSNREPTNAKLTQIENFERKMEYYYIFLDHIKIWLLNYYISINYIEVWVEFFFKKFITLSFMWQIMSFVATIYTTNVKMMIGHL